MKTSNQIGQLATALAKAQGEMQNAVKDSENPYYKSKYADLESVWGACRAALSQNGLAVIQSPSFTDPDLLTVTTLLLHASGEWVEDAISGRLKPRREGGEIDMQVIGLGISYLRRYALEPMVGVARKDDDGEAAVGRGVWDRRTQNVPPEVAERDPRFREPEQNSPRAQTVHAITAAVVEEHRKKREAKAAAPADPLEPKRKAIWMRAVTLAERKAWPKDILMDELVGITRRAIGKDKAENEEDMDKVFIVLGEMLEATPLPEGATF